MNMTYLLYTKYRFIVSHSLFDHLMLRSHRNICTKRICTSSQEVCTRGVATSLLQKTFAILHDALNNQIKSNKQRQKLRPITIKVTQSNRGISSTNIMWKTNDKIAAPSN